MATSDHKVELLMKDLKRKRVSINCRLTNFGKYVNSFEDVELTLHQRTELKLRMAGSQSLMKDFNLVQTQIEEISVEIDIEKQLESREDFEQKYYNILALAECLTTADEKSKGMMSEPPITSSKSIKLPTISVPTFDGLYEHWLEFRDIFLSLIHNSETITEIQKFHYLKSSLSGNAKSVIDSIEFSANNYKVAWELLLNRFDNTKLLVHNHIKSMFTMQSLTKESPVQLRRLIDNILKNLRALKLLGEPTEYWDTLIIYIIVTKLDSITEREWEQHKCSLITSTNNTKTVVKLNDLLHFLRNRADILETLIVSHSKAGVYSATDNNKRQFSNQLTSKFHCNIVSNKPNNNKSQGKNARNYKPCIMCNDLHPLYSCQKFLDLSVQNRLKFIQTKQLCPNCMRPGHTVDTCVFGPCRKCDQKHNSLICDVIKYYDHSFPEVTLPSCEQSAVPSNTKDNSNAHSFQAQSADTIDNMHPAQPVLLSTAIVEIRSQSGVYHQARALLDSGSERSFITQTVCDKLNPPILQSTQEIHGVGNTITQCSQSCDIEIKSRTGSYAARIQCLILPHITSNLPMKTYNVNLFTIPDNIVLADPTFYDSQQIDLLIGADLFWELVREGKIRLKNGPYLQNTHLGWIISGSFQSITRKQRHVSCNFTQTVDSDTCSLDQLLRNF